MSVNRGEAREKCRRHFFFEDEERTGGQIRGALIDSGNGECLVCGGV